MELSLNSAFFVKLAQLAQVNRTSNGSQFMELVNVCGTASTECSVASLIEHQTYIPRTWVETQPGYCVWLLQFLANLSNLAKLLSRN